MASDATIKKYTAVHRQMQLRKKPVNDGAVKEFSDYVDFCGNTESSSLDTILGGDVDNAIRNGFVKRHVMLEQGASDGVEAETDTSG